MGDNKYGVPYFTTLLRRALRHGLVCILSTTAPYRTVSTVLSLRVSHDICTTSATPDAIIVIFLLFLVWEDVSLRSGRGRLGEAAAGGVRDPRFRASGEE
jgi:hypothetical protein